MTYEQAGHSVAGRAYEMENGDTLTLLDRITHHKTTAFSTVETASKNASRITQQFEKYFEQIASDPPSDYKSFVIKSTNPIHKIKKLTTLLDRHEIKYGTLGKSVSIDKETEFKIAGVFANPPKNSSLEFDFVLNYKV